MGQLSRLLLSGLVGLTLAVAAVPAQASWAVSITDVMNLVHCLVGSGECAGLQPGADTVVISVDNQDAHDVGYAAGVASVDITTDNPSCDWGAGEVWDGTSCSALVAPLATQNCFLMGLCAQDGAASWGILGPYEDLTFDDAGEVGPECSAEYVSALNLMDYINSILLFYIWTYACHY
jgi:hypothetical protein